MNNLTHFEIRAGYTIKMNGGPPHGFLTIDPGPRAGQWWCVEREVVGDTEQLVDFVERKLEIEEVRDASDAVVFRGDDIDAVNDKVLEAARAGAGFERVQVGGRPGRRKLPGKPGGGGS